MHILKTRFRHSTIGIPGLLFIYILLGVLGLIFSSRVIKDTLLGNVSSSTFILPVFLLIPTVLIIFLCISLIRLVRDVISKRAGGKFQAKLVLYLSLTAALASAPLTIINYRLVTQLVHSWETAELELLVEDAQWSALDSYRYRLAVLEKIIESGELDGIFSKKISDLFNLDEALLAVQEFIKTKEDIWQIHAFMGSEEYRLEKPPETRQGFLPRDSDKDNSIIRYLYLPSPDRIRLVSFDLGKDFDLRAERLNKAKPLLENMSILEPRIESLLWLFYIAFSLPTLLMTIIIALSFAGSVTKPVVNLAEATHRVAQGDFSIRILNRPGNELSSLTAAFNSMVLELEKSRTAALEAEKINIWQDIAQRLAHEIKNPLTPIKLSAERVLRRFKNEPEKIDEILESCMLGIIQEVDGLSALLSEFRTFSRLPSPNLLSTPLFELIEESINLYRTSYPEIEFKTESVDPQVILRADRRHLAQALSNLILNAIDAMDGTGTLEFGSDLVKKRDSRYCRLRLKDSGKGISEEDKIKVFTPYFTTKQTGTGLGLSIVERIVKDHGGTIWFDSAPEAGTCFFIDLPIDQNLSAMEHPDNS